MALVSLFFNRPKRAKIGQMELDVSVNETHDASATLSQSEIEDGSTITDNVVLSSIKLTLEGVVSKTPINASSLIGSAATALGGAAGAVTAGGFGKLAGAAKNVAIGSIGGLVASALDDNIRNPADVYEYLLELRQKRLPFDVVTALKIYPNMVLTNLSIPRNAQNIGVLRFTATLEQVRYVSAIGVSLSSLSGLTSLGTAAEPTTNLGKQAATGASEKATSNGTILFKTFIAK